MTQVSAWVPKGKSWARSALPSACSNAALTVWGEATADIGRYLQPAFHDGGVRILIIFRCSCYVMIHLASQRTVTCVRGVERVCWENASAIFFFFRRCHVGSSSMRASFQWGQKFDITLFPRRWKKDSLFLPENWRSFALICSVQWITSYML